MEERSEGTSFVHFQVLLEVSDIDFDIYSLLLVDTTFGINARGDIERARRLQQFLVEKID